MMTKAEAFKATPLFRGLPDARIDELANLATVLPYKAGDTVFVAGESGTSLYVVWDGEVEVLINGPNKTQIVLALAGPGATVGELSLLDGGLRSATVVATKESELLALTRSAFLSLLEDEAVVHAIIIALSNRLRDTNTLLAELAILVPPARFARALLELAERDGRETPDGTLIARDVTVAYLAARTALYKSTVEKLLQDYQLDDVIRKDGDALILHRPDVLKWAARGPA
jgi:CRP-like cAMP-binding protein